LTYIGDWLHTAMVYLD